ncbi:SIR2 family protein [Solidesulfovibrio sp.]|uniref:SIR2 family protein n=1 Tax=Solidesulfovibrio sp. TaxID=2910990 RepID=UPI002B2142AC|nr:SIR2 family protein [Solidesulfovibrio sp.]MEA4856120.1 SIR2 family protein [Solidesulfovibrio sp.]
MIDPLHSLAFSIQANPSIYALLLGSGVSRSARIPTGWEITLDLVRKLAEVSDESTIADPILWYREKYGKEPDYSELLDALAKTPSERQQLLRSYLEPSEEERAEGIKAPTAAHRAIASLAAKGYVRVIITTNFDRLMETALVDAGIVSTVLSSLDQIHGAMPLIHTRCCLFKVHGDYLDTRIRNTHTELESYPSEFNILLDRILDEFGLITCGWSAEWDPALRNAIERSASRRFSYFWALRGEPSISAMRLIEHRRAQTIPIADADNFFSELNRLVDALDQFSRPHPLSTGAAVVSLKSYLADPIHRIRLADLISGEVDRVRETTAGAMFAVQGGPDPDSQTFTARVHAYEAACGTLIAMAAAGGYWIERWHYATWMNALARLATRRNENGTIYWLDLQVYPACLLFYTLGIGSIEAGEHGLMFLGEMFRTPIHREHRKDIVAVEQLPAFCLFDEGSRPARLLEGMDRRQTPLNDWLHNLLTPQFRGIIPSDSRFSYAFDKLEILAALSYSHHVKDSLAFGHWTPPGRYVFRYEDRTRIIESIRDSLSTHKNNSPYVKSSIFGQTFDECIVELDKFIEWISTLKGRRL